LFGLAETTKWLKDRPFDARKIAQGKPFGALDACSGWAFPPLTFDPCYQLGWVDNAQSDHQRD
jgi:hypothetical protein